MRKFTLYQASKLTKISRYKLEQAISEGILKTQGGKGNIKLFILESDLESFLEEHGDQYRRIEFNDNKDVYISPEITNFVSRDIHDQIVKEKERIIELLERQYKETEGKQVLELRQIVKEALRLAPDSEEKKAINMQLSNLVR